jgi:large subunit ribosomal protein L17
MPAAPKKGPRFGGDAAHQKAMMGNLIASLIAADANQSGLVTTEAKAKAMRPIAEKLITKAVKGGVHNQRQVVAYIRDKDMAHRLFAEVAPRYRDLSPGDPGSAGGYLRILKLGQRLGDSAPMAKIEFV